MQIKVTRFSNSWVISFYISCSGRRGLEFWPGDLIGVSQSFHVKSGLVDLPSNGP
jgi:hypothetical protein